MSGLRFTDATTLVWDPELSAGSYQLYEGLLTNPFDDTYGTCSQSGITGETTTVTADPAAGQGLFLLVTAENLLGEEGTKGTNSEDSERGTPLAGP